MQRKAVTDCRPLCQGCGGTPAINMKTGIEYAQIEYAQIEYAQIHSHSFIRH